MVYCAILGWAPEWLGWHHCTHHASPPASSAGEIQVRYRVTLKTHTHTQQRFTRQVVWGSALLISWRPCESVLSESWCESDWLLWLCVTRSNTSLWPNRKTRNKDLVFIKQRLNYFLQFVNMSHFSKALQKRGSSIKQATFRLYRTLKGPQKRVKVTLVSIHIPLSSNLRDIKETS